MKLKNSSEQSIEFFCPSCGSENIKDRWLINDGDRKLSVLWFKNCGPGQLNPIPTVEELKQQYSSQPVYGLNYRNESHGGFPIRVKRLSKLFPQRGRLLDIGSGLGYFLKIAQDDGWEVEGIEPRSAAAKYCYENFTIKAHEGFLEDFESKPGIYDVITLWDVLEHVSNHIRFIERSIDLLAPGGILVLAIPNASGLPARIFKGRWRYVMASHLHYFKMPYIKQLLTSRKMVVERADHTLKIHSLIQGFISLLPFNVDKARVFKLGIRDNDQKINLVENSGSINRKENPLKIARKLVFKFNMIKLPWDIGDMVDLYCRKGR